MVSFKNGLAKDPGTGVWLYCFKTNGQLTKGSTRARDRKTALKVLGDRRREVVLEQRGLQSRIPVISELIQAWRVAHQDIHSRSHLRIVSDTSTKWLLPSSGDTRVNRVFDDEDIQKIANAVHAWRQDGETKDAYADVPGFCRSVKLEEIHEHGFVLTPGRYVGAEVVEDDDEAFADKMERLTSLLSEQMEKGQELDALIRERLGRLGYGV